MVRVLLFGCIVAASLVAVLAKDLFTSVISLGAVSTAVGGLFFALDLNYAGAFELNAGAGLTTIMFVAMLGMISKDRKVLAKRWFQFDKTQAFGAILTVGLVVALGLSMRLVPAFTPVMSSDDVGEVLWKLRAPDIAALGLLIFSGALGISAMFHDEGRRDDV